MRWSSRAEGEDGNATKTEARKIEMQASVRYGNLLTDRQAARPQLPFFTLLRSFG